MRVTIPSIREHSGMPSNLITVEIVKTCPKCGKERGRVFGGLSYDGSRRMNVDSWKNPCGHIDFYEDIIQEGRVVEYKEPTPYNVFADEIDKTPKELSISTDEIFSEFMTNHFNYEGSGSWMDYTMCFKTARALKEHLETAFTVLKGELYPDGFEMSDELFCKLMEAEGFGFGQLDNITFAEYKGDELLKFITSSLELFPKLINQKP